MRARGVTLVELLVGATLLVLVFVLTFGYLIPATKAAYRYRTRSHLHQLAVVVLARLEEAAGTTAPGGLSWSESDPVALGFNPVDRVQAGNAALLWTNRFELFWWDQSAQALKHTNWPPGPPTQEAGESSILKAKRLSRSRIREITLNAPQSRVLAEGVTGFSVTHAGDESTLIQPVKVSIEITETGPREAQDKQVVRQSLTFRVVNQQ